ncbi:PepSY domain-containing protein [Methylobacterium sp. 10]|uniref:PepSY domain-containing protein n=1 Tax=Methylobacterium sp. 10 TaxID=1101191 RepID=UPI000488676F|nr:PepSY domain-containing protein [Methylobacterium sp. 10]
MRILLALLFIGLTVAAFATGPIRTLAEGTMTSGTAEVSAPMHPVPPSESCLSPADLREAVADKRVIEPVAAIRAARTVISRAEIQRARLCRYEDGLAYLLTALRRDGQFVHVLVDATTGRVIGK